MGGFEPPTSSLPRTEKKMKGGESIRFDWKDSFSEKPAVGVSEKVFFAIKTYLIMKILKEVFQMLIDFFKEKMYQKDQEIEKLHNEIRKLREEIYRLEKDLIDEKSKNTNENFKLTNRIITLEGKMSILEIKNNDIRIKLNDILAKLKNV